MPIAAYAKHGRRLGPSGERQVEGLRVVTVRALACKWLQHFGDAAQRAKIERTYVDIFKERARQTLALPFDPSLDAVDRRSIDILIGFDVPWIDLQTKESA
jgi:hypothetical protein